MNLQQIPSRFFPCGQSHLHYRFLDNPDKPVVVWLHSAFGDQRIFTPQVAALADRYSLLLLDLPGHGQSSRFDPDLTITRVPDLLIQLMDQLKIQKAHLVGVSMGSIVAQYLASQHRERILSLTVIGGYSIHHHARAALLAQQREMLNWLPLVLFAMTRFRSYVTRYSVASAEGRAIFAEAAQCFTRRSFAAMRDLDRLYLDEQPRPDYPLMFIVGEEDFLIIHELATQLIAADSRVRLENIAQAGHCANLDNPGLVNPLLDTFWQQVKTDS